jgi:lipopolysaccharide transport system permease protein
MVVGILVVREHSEPHLGTPSDPHLEASSSEAAEAPQTVVRIRPTRGWVSLNLRELWHYRELLYFLTWRDIKVRYKQTALGAAWAIIQPLMTMVAFSLFFGQLGKIPSDGVPYPVFSYVGLLPWTFFANALGQASASLVGNANLISKVYFPRLVVPISSVLSGVIDFGIAFVVLIGLMAYFQLAPTLAAVLLIPFLVLALVTALGVGLWLSALNVEYRDVRYAVPFLTQFWLFATPVAYPSSLLPEPWRTLYGLNPMAGVVEGFRWALLGTNPPGPMLVVSVAAAIVLLVTGAFYFRRMERMFADVV